MSLIQTFLWRSSRKTTSDPLSEAVATWKILSRIHWHNSHLPACPHGFACPEHRRGLCQHQSLAEPAGTQRMLHFQFRKHWARVWGEKRLHHQLVGMSEALGVQQGCDNSQTHTRFSSATGTDPEVDEIHVLVPQHCWKSHSSVHRNQLLLANRKAICSFFY